MVKAVFFDFYKTLAVWGQQSFEASLKKIAARYHFEINWERYEAAVESLFVDTPLPNLDTDYLMESVMATMM